MRNPIRAAFTVPYGAAFGAVRAGGARSHWGLDEHAPEGTAIFAGQGGKVIARGYTSGYGNYAEIAYPGNISVRYAHMQYPASLSQGQSWNTGEPQLGQVGLTGSAAYGNPPGPHLHVEVRIFGTLVDPAKFFTHMTPAGSTGSEINAAEDDPMFKFLYDTNPNGGVYIAAPGSKGVVHVRNPEHLSILQRVKAGESNYVFSEVQLIESYMKELSPNPTAHALAPTVDQIKTAIAAALAAAPSVTTESGVDLDELTAYLGSEFGKINANIDDQPTTFTVTPA